MPIHGKLGKKPPKIDPRTLRLGKYLSAALPAPPAYADWSRGFTFDWGEMLNQNLGDCTIAACGHAIQTWTLDNGRLVTVPDSAILRSYEQSCGYNPADPSTDQGGVEVDVLNYFRTTGVGGHQILAYVDPDPGNALHIKQSVYLFGGVYIGFNVPQSAMDQFNAGQPWTPIPNDGGIVGGHAVYVCGYNSQYLVLYTWGTRTSMSWDFWSDPRYVDESHTLLSQDWTTRGGIGPNGINMTALQADLAAVTA